MNTEKSTSDTFINHIAGHMLAFYLLLPNMQGVKIGAGMLTPLMLSVGMLVFELVVIAAFVLTLFACGVIILNPKEKELKWLLRHMLLPIIASIPAGLCLIEHWQPSALSFENFGTVILASVTILATTALAEKVTSTINTLLKKD